MNCKGPENKKYRAPLTSAERRKSPQTSIFEDKVGNKKRNKKRGILITSEFLLCNFSTEASQGPSRDPAQPVTNSVQRHLRRGSRPLAQQASKICSWKKFLYCYLVRNGSFEKGGVNSMKSGSACTSLTVSNAGQICG